MENRIEKVQKRDGSIVPFDQSRIEEAIFKALTASGEGDGKRAKRLSNKVVQILNRRFKKGEIPHVEQIQDIVEEVLILEGLVKTAKAYILYREQRRRIREAIAVSEEAVDRLDQYLEKLDWEVQENANMAFSLQGLNHYGVTYIVKKYWLNKIYPPEIREANESGDFHIHNLDTLGPYCVGWDLYDLLMKGFGGVPGKVESKPAKHFDTALMQCVNFLYTLQGEAAGAVSFSNFDTLLSPFIRYDNLNYQQVKQALQEFIFNMSVPTRVGFQNPFSNLTLDLKPSPVFAKMPVIIGGKPQEKTYSEFEEEMKIFDKALYEVYMEGDAKGRPFSVSGDSVCLIKNSGKIKLIEIGEYIDRLMEKKNPIFIKENNCQVLDVRNSNIMTLGIKEGRVVWQKVNFLVRHPVNELLRIWTVGGFNIKATRSHSVFVLKNGKIQSCEASELKVGDWLVSPKIIPRSSSNESLEISLAEEFLKRGKEEGIYIQNVKKKNGKRLWQKRIYKNSIGHVSTLPLSFIKEKLKEIDLSQAKISLRGSKIKIENNLKISDELVEFLGWYVAEGSAEKNKKHGGISLGLNLEKEKDKALHLASLIKKIWTEVPIKIREIKERNLIEIRIHSKLIRRIITEIFGIENKKEKKVPDFIFEISPEKKKIFLKAYFQGDAKITGEEIQVSSISQKLIYGISTLLKQLNVFHTLTEYYIEGVPRWRVNIWGKTDLAPRQSYTISKIPIKESGLIEIVEKILEKEPYFYDSLGRKYKNTKNRIFKKFGIDILTSQSTGLENAKKLIKYAEKLGIEIPSTLKEIEKGEILFLRIKKIESLKEEKMVYDFSTENENFIANQLLVHNTFPIPTINITKDFPWDEPAFDGIFEASAKYGINYFANYINSEMKPEDVRSMCLEANEEILIRNSKKIKRLSIKEVAENYKNGEFDKEGWVECKKEGNLEVLSLNPKTLKLEWVPVKRFLKIKDDKAVEVITEDGKISLFSLKHPVSVYTPEGIKMKFAKDLQKGDYLLTLKRADEIIFSKEYQKIEDLVLDEDLAKILGYFVADGNYLFESRKGSTHFGEPRGMQFTFKTGDQENLEEIKCLIRKVFNLPTYEKQDPRYNTYYLYVYNAEIARKLYRAGFRKYGRLPQILFNSPKSVIESFLEFYFRGDGYGKRKEIHLNDLELSRDLVLLFSLVEKPVTYKLRKKSQRIYLQHAKSKIKKGIGWLNNPILAERVPGWMAVSTAKVPGLIKSRTVGFNTLEKYNAHTEESLKIKNSDIYLVRVKEIKIRRYKRLKEFYDIELERNHLFVHSLGQISFNCCRLRLDLTELYNRGGGGLFGAGAKTGSIGVVTINLPRIGYLSKTKKEFFERLAKVMDLAKESLEIKRKVIENFIEKGLYPYSRYYLQDIKRMRGKYWANHFSTIGLVGMNECLLNFMGENIASKRGRKFALEVLDFMRERLVKYQEETGNIYNLEATPAESTAYRLALKDKERYPEIITAGTKKVPFYTNSSQLPVNFTDDVFEALKLQDEIQCKYTGGTVLHIFLGERMQSGEGVKKLVKKVFENFRLPYITVTPTFCYDEKTQILTENGWKFFWELKEDEKVLTANPETKELSYQLPLRRFKFYYQGPMIHFKSRTFDCKVTPDHRMFISGKKIKLRDPKTGKFIKSQMTNYFVKAKDVSFNDRVPMTGFKWKGKEEKFFLLPGVINNKVSTLIPQIEELLKENKTQKEIAGFCNCSQSLVSMVKTGKRGISENFLPIRIPMETWLKFFGIWIAEGSVRGSKGGEIGSNYKYEVVIKQKNRKIKNEIREMLKELPFKFSEFPGGFVIYNKQLWHYLYQFGNSRTKYIPKEIKALSPRLLKIFLEWYLKGDGSKDGKYCCSFSPRLRDDLQEIYLKIGFDASVSEKGIITKRTHRFTYLKEIMHIDNYSGYVYCVEVPNHVIYVRRNGKPNFSGNSICPVHGYIPGEHFFCPKCTIKQPCEVYTRIVGYYRPVQQFNLGKQQEFKQRKEFKIKETILK